MTTDNQGRRLQWGTRQPIKKLFVWQDADYRQFELMDRHGWLPSSYLYAGSKHLRADETQTKNRLTELYHGSLTQGYFLDRHPQQFAQLNAHARHVVTRLAPKAEALLAERGTKESVAPTNSAWFIHQLMQGCVGASLELCVPEGFRYVSRSEVLTSDKCGDARGTKNPVAIPHNNKTFTPDDLFALERDDKKRYFLIEIDRATESMDGYSGATYFAEKLDVYKKLYASGIFKSWYGFNRPNLLIVTTNPTRAERIRRHLARFEESLHGRLYVTDVPNFGANWRVPAHLFSQLYEKPWLTPKGEHGIID